jgi:hypothetical protein
MVKLNDWILLMFSKMLSWCLLPSTKGTQVFFFTGPRFPVSSRAASIICTGRRIFVLLPDIQVGWLTFLLA